MSPHVPNIDQLDSRDVSKSGGNILPSKALRPKCAKMQFGGFSLGPSAVEYRVTPKRVISSCLISQNYLVVLVQTSIASLESLARARGVEF